MKKSSFVLYLGGVALIGLSVGGVALLSHARSSQAREEIDGRKELQAAGPKVLFEKAKKTAPERVVTVQAEARPFAEVTLYAKVAGYLRDIHVDKGDEVKRGTLLARIEAPELDAQLVAAQADAKYKKVNAKRADALATPGVVSAQDRDVAVSSAEVAEATQRSYETQKGYELLRAPFDGTVTARFVDPGALLQNAANGQAGALPIVTVSQIDTLRIYGYVDQRDAPFIKVGDVAEVRLKERPGEVFKAKVARVSGELDPRTRMMLVEVDLENHDRQIVAGSYVDTTLHLPVPSYVSVPAAALLVRNRAPFVAVLDEQDRVNFRSIELADDDGETVRILKGVDEGQRVVLNLGDRVADGTRVQPVSSGPAGGPTGGVDVQKPK